jgi:hypothetical protein
VWTGATAIFLDQVAGQDRYGTTGFTASAEQSTFTAERTGSDAFSGYFHDVFPGRDNPSTAP